jgi:membrane protein implicated in regulation of membrane protease activity
MLTIYIFCAVIGGGLIVMSLMGGDHDHGGDADIGHDVDLAHDADLGHDADVGHDADHGHDSGHGDGPWLLFFSMRFWTYFFGVFGVAGIALTLFADSAEPATALLSGGAGFASGLFASALVQLIRRNEADSTAREADFLGLRAKVTVPIREQQVGRIRATVKGELIDVLAVSEEPLALPEGSEVVIVGMEGGRATVMPLQALLEENS